MKFITSLLFLSLLNLGFAQNGIQVYTKREKGIEFVAKDSIFQPNFNFGFKIGLVMNQSHFPI